MDEHQIEQITGQYQQDPTTMKIERVACYIRVSTQEQKLHGISLDAQRDKLTQYAKDHGLMIVGWYEDEGISGRKLIKRRPDLQRMLHDAEKGLFDRIIFIKIDRYFRSVAEYMECQKILDSHDVKWTATEERYDLTTASGRYWVTQKLAMAEYEADNTGERIKLVNEYKIRTGQALIGARCQGIGFTVKKDAEGIKRVVKDETTQGTRAA
jgi:DNA invertase Pin-like site-specific DNA recombinase